ncbi:MAG TPA: hypothetical protein VHQ65_17420 [Thermoanaerobaculia bacterium]|nr:hypothetical protein [Thermoanaerobaculia bacterium]
MKCAGRHYLVHEGRLYRIADERPRFSFAEKLGDPRRRGEFLRLFRDSSEELITLGGDVMAVAVPIDPH